jgi:hypothetical protein
MEVHSESGNAAPASCVKPSPVLNAMGCLDDAVRERIFAAVTQHLLLLVDCTHYLYFAASHWGLIFRLAVERAPAFQRHGRGEKESQWALQFPEGPFHQD